MGARDYEDAYQRDDKPREVKSNRAWRLECESLRQQLAECERERDELKTWLEDQVCEGKDFAYKLEGKTVDLATVTAERDELVMILKWVDKYVSCAISQEIKEVLAKLGADKTGEGS